MSLLGKLFSRIAADGDDDFVFRPTRKLDIVRIAERGASEFRADAMNLLSCYELEGEFGLYSALGNYVQTKNPMTAEISEAVQDGDEITLAQAFRRAMELAFVTLLEKGALQRLQLCQWPAEATTEYARIRKSVGTTAAANVAPVVAPTPAAPPVVETPAEVAAREWTTLSGDQYRVKYLNNRNNRPAYEQALANGLIK